MSDGQLTEKQLKALRRQREVIAEAAVYVEQLTAKKSDLMEQAVQQIQRQIETHEAAKQRAVIGTVRAPQHAPDW